MEFLDKLGEWFAAFTGIIERLITSIFGSSNERRIRKIGFVRDKAGNVTITPGSVLDKINKLEPACQQLSDEELKQTATKFRERLAKGETLDDLLPEMFARARESGRRYLKMRHYDTQMIGGYILHNGMIAEMVTGEGKTLVATLPTALNALAGKVHVVTVNDYLARRDMEWMGPLYLGLGLTVNAIQSDMDPWARRKAYQCDITYGTNNEFGFDYLRDNMKPTADLQCQGPLVYAVVDEIDNILIDEARTPLIISGPAQDDVDKYAKANRIAMMLHKGEHFEVKEKEHTCHLTEAGIRKAEEIAGVESFYTTGNMEWPHLIDNALKAHHLYKKDVNYVVMRDDETGDMGVVIVDEFTGRLMKGRQWSDGLHQAVEAKEGVRIKPENQTLATITLQNYFKLYKKLAGMTGTAMTEAAEFWKVYKLDVVTVPTNRPMKRINHPDVIYRSDPEKWNALIEEIREVHKTGRPILVGTTSIEKSELISNKLQRFGVKHAVLNAKHHEREAEYVAQAGRLGAVTIATNMAGRGTDIILGGNPEHMAWEILKQKYSSRLEVPKSEWDALTKEISEREGMAAEGRKVAELGGLHVIGTERHDARRIDLQLRGRCGRQGDPGSSRFFLSLDDTLMRLFAGEWVKNMLTRLGMQEGEAIESRMVTNRIEAAQKKREETHFDTRKNLLEYDEVMDEQRKQVYAYRQKILDGANCRELILDMIDRMVHKAVTDILDPQYRAKSITAWAAQNIGVEIEASALKEMDEQQLDDYIREKAIDQADTLIRDQIDENLPEGVEDEREWNWLALSKWANARYGLNTNDRELKKIGRSDIYEYLFERAKEAIGRVNLQDLSHFTRDDFSRRSLCGFLQQQFTIECTPEDFEGKSIPEAEKFIGERIRELYHNKEVTFPVSVGMTKFMAESSDKGGERYNREGLIKWANDRFRLRLDPEQVRTKPRTEIESLLTDGSRSYLGEKDVVSRVDEYLDKAYGEKNGHDARQDKVREPQVVAQLAQWANEEFHSNLQPADLESLSRGDARVRVLHEYDQKCRPELYHAERALLLEVVDTVWKEHLHYMDHIRSGIGLVAYAQKDAKVEYKREGRKAFLQMWDRIADQVTGAIFRLEKESPAFVGDLWKITATTHEEAYDPAPTQQDQQYLESHGGREPGAEAKAVEPIRNRSPQVGRNDPCPCGSGKKYKKCCGADM